MVLFCFFDHVRLSFYLFLRIDDVGGECGMSKKLTSKKMWGGGGNSRERDKRKIQLDNNRTGFGIFRRIKVFFDKVKLIEGENV